MDGRHFDVLTRNLTGPGNRRSLLGLLTALPILGGLFALVDPDEADAKGRRQRRKKRHKHGKGRDKGKHKKPCKPQAKTKTCAGRCGSVTNNCKKSVDCGSCDCPAACAPCFLCQSGQNTPGACVPDPDQAGEPCGNGQVCDADGVCACPSLVICAAGGCCPQSSDVCDPDDQCCAPVDPCTGSACGVVTDNCGQSITCLPCPPQITSFTATPATIDRGAATPETALLSWSTTDADTCALDDGGTPATVNCNDSLVVGPGATTTYTLHASGAGGGPVTDEVTVAVEYCHAITSQGTCPSGATEYCQATPIVATSSDAAKAACEACNGDACSAATGPIGGSMWAMNSPLAFFYYSAASGPDCDNFIPQAGDITNGGACSLGRWAP